MQITVGSLSTQKSQLFVQLVISVAYPEAEGKQKFALRNNVPPGCGQMGEPGTPSSQWGDFIFVGPY